jgi:hypothetical protein
MERVKFGSVLIFYFKFYLFLFHGRARLSMGSLAAVGPHSPGQPLSASSLSTVLDPSPSGPRAPGSPYALSRPGHPPTPPSFPFLPSPHHHHFCRHISSAQLRIFVPPPPELLRPPRRLLARKTVACHGLRPLRHLVLPRATTRRSIRHTLPYHHVIARSHRAHAASTAHSTLLAVMSLWPRRSLAATPHPTSLLMCMLRAAHALRVSGRSDRLGRFELLGRAVATGCGPHSANRLVTFLLLLN